jgi:hypothetical protein
MATFKESKDFVNKDTACYYYKFHIINHTSNTSVNYDFNPLVKSRFVRWNSGDRSGQISSGGNATSNFDVVYGVLEEGNTSIIIIGSHEIHFRFWSGSDGQYINLIELGGFKVTADTPEYNELKGNNLKITLDGGGQEATTLNIYIQMYDA